MEYLSAVALGQYLITLLSSGFNALYFWLYRTPDRGRRLGAVVMALVSLATFSEALALSLAGRPWAPIASLPWLGARLLVALASLTVSLLILRRWLGGRI
jgi:hypothetical protein